MLDFLENYVILLRSNQVRSISRVRRDYEMESFKYSLKFYLGFKLIRMSYRYATFSGQSSTSNNLPNNEYLRLIFNIINLQITSSLYNEVPLINKKVSLIFRTFKLFKFLTMIWSGIEGHYWLWKGIQIRRINTN